MGITRQHRATWLMGGKLHSPGPPPRRQRDQLERFWKDIAKGATTEHPALAAGASFPVDFRWFCDAGTMCPINLPPAPGRYLSLAEREEIAIERAPGSGVREIARYLGRSPSRISRELRRNAATHRDSSGYRATVAEWHAERRRKHPKQAGVVTV